MVSDTVGTVDSGSVVGMEVLSDREPACWVGKGLWEATGIEQEQVRRPGKLGAGILEVSEWAEERCSADFVS